MQHSANCGIVSNSRSKRRVDRANDEFRSMNDEWEFSAKCEMRNAKLGREFESEPGAIATGFHRIAERPTTTAGRRSARLSQNSPRGTLFSKWDNIFAAIAGNRTVTLSHLYRKRDKSGTRMEKSRSRVPRAAQNPLVFLSGTISNIKCMHRLNLTRAA